MVQPRADHATFRTLRPTGWRLVVNLLVLGGFAAAVILRRGDLGRAIDGLGDVTPGWIAVLGVMTLVRLLTQGMYTAAVTPGIGLVQGIAVHEVTTGANNTVVGSGLVSTGLRISMLRSWRTSDAVIGMTIVTLNVVAAYLVWLVAGAAALTALLATSGVVATPISVGVIAAAVAVLGCSTGLWWLLLTSPRTARWLAQRGERLVGIVRRHIKRLPSVDLVAHVERWRQDAGQILRTRRGRIAGTAMLNQVLVIATPICVVRAFGISGAEVTVAEAFSAYGLVRLAAALSPLPGGIGVTELGLATLLIRFGGDDTRVFAAVLAYRMLTFVFPIITGAAAFLWWRRSPVHARDRAKTQRAADALVAQSAAPLID